LLAIHSILERIWKNLECTPDKWIFRGDLIGDVGRGKTQYNLGSDALPHAKDAEEGKGAPQEDRRGPA
jgi:hypothetical protein